MFEDVSESLIESISNGTTSTTTATTLAATLHPECTFSYPDVSLTTRYVAGIGFATCGVLAAFGNTLSLVVILLRPKMRRTKSNRIIASLAMSDVLVGYILCPLIATQLLSESLRHSCLVEMAKNLGGPMMVGTSAFTVALIGYDRYVFLSNTGNYNARLSTRKINLIIVWIWMFQLVLFATIFIHRILYLLCLGVFLILPFVVISVSYYLVVRYVKLNSFGSNHNIVEEDYNANNERIRQSNNRKMVHRLKVLVFCYFLCLSPLVINLFIEMLLRVTKREKSVGFQTLTVFASLMAMCNSIINPLIYVAKFPGFKEELRNMFTIRKNFIITKTSSTEDGLSSSST